MIINNRTIIIGMVAGESSGDILGVGLIRSLKKHLKKVHFFGIGGAQMKSEGMKCWYDTKDLSMMGITEIIWKLPNLLMIRKMIINRFLKLNLDVFIGIDFPDFNFSLEKKLKKRGICIIHYVSPSIWAWRRDRIFDIKKNVDNILLLFPFEKPIYDRFNIPNQFVGHRLADEIPLNPDKIFIRKRLGIAYNKRCLAILPGSRIKEIKLLTYDFLMSAKLLSDHISNFEILIPLNDQKLIDQFLKLASSIKVKFRILNACKAWEVMGAADVSLIASGTATLECMLVKCPMIVGYRMSILTFMIAKKLVKIPWISLPNLLFNCELVQEFVQNECRFENLFKALFNLFNYNTKERCILLNKFYRLHKMMKLHADERAAQSVLKFIKF